MRRMAELRGLISYMAAAAVRRYSNSTELARMTISC